MSSATFDRMQKRARAVKARAAVRRWQYRQRNLAAGVWLELRRSLAGASAAYAITPAEARRLVADGYRLEACGSAIAPEKPILFVDRARIERIDPRQSIRVGLGADFLAAPAVALVAFEDE